MIFLRNIRKDEYRIYGDYYPEDSKILFGTVSVNLNDLDDYTINESGYERDFNNHKAHAINALRDIIEGKREMKDTQIMWY